VTQLALELLGGDSAPGPTTVTHATLPGVAQPSLCVVRRGFPGRPAFGTAVSRAILIRVAAGELPATLRLHRPGPILAFSRQDRASPGFAAAVRAARDCGFESVLRLAGGRAAVFHEQTLACSWAVRDSQPAARITERFRELAELLAAALVGLGVEARVGAIPGEYCPGAWSVNAGGRTKLVGIGQRLIAGAAHRGAVIVVGGSERIRQVLVPVYEALGLEWDPATAGCVEDEIGKVRLDAVEKAILSGLGQRYRLSEQGLDATTLELAARLEPDHGIGRPGA
jgi:octanoyl-[GcvH]:protein N-octanoyltransferase